MRSTTMMDDDRALATLGMTVLEDLDGSATVTMRVREDMSNGHRICHGGFVFALADTAFAYACNNSDDVTVAAGAEITFIRPAKLGSVLTARAERRSESGRSGIYDVTVTSDDGTLIAEFRGHSRTLAQR